MKLADIRKQFPQYNDVGDEQLVTALYSKHYANKMSFDDFTDRVGYKPAIRGGGGGGAGSQERPATVTDRRTVKPKGLIETAGALIDRGTASVDAGGNRFGAALQQWSADNPLPWTSPEQTQRSANLAVELRRKALRAEEAAGVDIEGVTSWQDVKKNPNPANVAGFAGGAITESLPALAGTVLAPFSAIAGMAGNTGQDRAVNDGRVAATAGDVAIGAPVAAGITVLDRLALGRLIAGGPSTSVTNRVIGAIANEAGTEAVQEVAEYAGGSVGTVKGFDPAVAGDNALAAAVAGGVFGGVGRGAIETGQGIVTATKDPIARGVEAITGSQARRAEWDAKMAEHEANLAAIRAKTDDDENQEIKQALDDLIATFAPTEQGTQPPSVAMPPIPFAAPAIPLQVAPAQPPVQANGGLANTVEPPPAEASAAGGKAQAPNIIAAVDQTDRREAWNPGELQEGEAYTRTPAGNRIRTRFEVVEASSLEAATGDLQNRDRTQAATSAQVQHIIAEFDPAQLGDDPSTDRGAPIVGPDSRVESGNGRMMALNQIYDTFPNKAEAYRQMIRDSGFSVEGFERPILVRRRTNEMTEAQLNQMALESNKDSKAQMNDAEMARVDSRSLTGAVLGLYKGGDVSNVLNGPFVSKFLEALTFSDRSAFLSPKGDLSPGGKARLQRALKFAAYDDLELTKLLDASLDNNIKSIGTSLDDTAGPWIAMRADTREGMIAPEWDITANLTQAAKEVQDIRNGKLTIEQALEQQDILNPRDPITEELIRLFYTKGLRGPASAASVTRSLNAYIKGARSQLLDPGFVPNEGPATPLDLLRDILSKRDAGDQPRLMAAEDRLDAMIEAFDEMEAEVDLPEPEYDRSGIKDSERGAYQDLFLEASFTNRISYYQDAVKALGYTTDQFVLLPPPRQLALLKKAMLDRYGIAVEVENNMPIIMAIDQLKDAFTNIGVMAHLLQLSESAISFDGRLSLKLLAKGNFLGAFQGGANVIMLPRRSNSFAHEWAHALDYRMLEQVTDEDFRGITGKVREKGLDFDPQNVSQAWINLVNTMFLDQAALALRIMKLEKTIAQTKSDKVREDAEATLKKIREGNFGAKSGNTQYYENAKAMKGDYWQRPTEMFARAFEAYVGMLLREGGFGSEFLGKSDQNYLSEQEARFADTFPKEQERELIFAAIREVIFQMNKEAMISRDTSPANAPNLERPLRLTDMDQRVESEPEAISIKAEIAEWNRHFRRLKWERSNRIDDPKTGMQRFHDIVAALFYSMAGKLDILAGRYKSAAIKTIRQKLAFNPGTPEQVGRTFHEATTLRRNRNQNRLTNILKAAKLDKMEPDELRMFRDLLIDENVTGASKEMRDAAAKVRTLLNEEWYANERAGIKIGYARNGYMPRDLDVARVLFNEAGFLDKAQQVYELVFNKKVGADGADVMMREGGLSRFARMAVRYDKKGRLTSDGSDTLVELKKKMKESSRIASAAKRAAKDGDDDAANKLLEKLSQVEREIEALIDDLLPEVRALWARDRADAWLFKIKSAADYDFDAHSPDSDYTESRELPIETDKIMEDFYTQDPVETILNYLAKSARRIAYAERFGPKGQVLEKLKEKMIDEGVSKEDQAEVLRVVAIATGRQAQAVGQSLTLFSNLIYAYGTIRLLSRAVISSIAEPMVAGINTGDVRQGFRALALTFVNSQTVDGKQRAELARAIGIVTDGIGEELLEARFGGTFGNSPRIDRMVAQMFEKTGLALLTRAQRGHMVAISHAYLDNLARQVLKGGKEGEDAFNAMVELGIRDPLVFAKELQAKNGLPSVHDLDTVWGEDYGLATKRFVDMTIQESNPMLRPQMANNPVGRMLYGIMSFSMAFWRNVTKRQAIKIYNMAKERGGIKATSYVAMNLAPAMFGLYFAQLIISVLREALLNPERTEELLEDEKWFETMLALAFTRTFSFGMGDPLIQAYTGLKYQRDLSNMFVGPYIGVLLQDMQLITQSLTRNSPDTNTSEYNLVKALYNLAVGPPLAMLMTTLPGGPLLQTASGIGIATVTSPAAGQNVAKAIVGDKGTKTE